MLFLSTSTLSSRLWYSGHAASVCVQKSRCMLPQPHLSLTLPIHHHIYHNNNTSKSPFRLACTSSPSSPTYPTSSSSAQHATLQRTTFDNCVTEFTQPLAPEIQQRLAEFVNAVPGLDGCSRVIDVGSGTGALIPHIQARGVRDILAVDLAPRMLDVVKERYCVSTLGNEASVRTWVGDVIDLPRYMGTADAIFFNAVFGNLYDQHAALVHCVCNLLRPGGYIIISHPEGRAWLASLHHANPTLVPHCLPDAATLRDSLLPNLPLHMVSYRDDDAAYCVVLQLPPAYALMMGGDDLPSSSSSSSSSDTAGWVGGDGLPNVVALEGPVVAGAGRGSKQMGTPTANIDMTTDVRDGIQHLAKGVYFGWAQVPHTGPSVYKMVVNIGDRPTLEDGRETTVEVYIMHEFDHDFYGQQVKIVLTGHIRPEIRFSSIPQLISRIKTDVSIAKYMLDEPYHQQYHQHVFFASDD